jgi:hypothetical protein
MIKNFTIYFLFFLTTSCALKQKPEFIKLETIEIVEANSKKITLRAEALFNNPNAVKGRMNTEGVNVSVNDILMGSIRAEEFKVPAKDTFKVPLQIEIDPIQLLNKDPDGFLGGLLNSVIKRSLNVKYEGIINFKVMGFTYKYPISKTEIIKIKL